ncbi:HMG2-induced ER-remodeling protein 1 [Candida viswanathii]|uniref:HMG2-induced ER-remodeling protein 1 n=1 Tax=Candida viswanathii TaxID=5486 RepID=A0A367YHH5_9ASCO|nr:HMG2-induced ER-remodeling protein 1 [Candida viswanathii]
MSNNQKDDKPEHKLKREHLTRDTTKQESKQHQPPADKPAVEKPNGETKSNATAAANTSAINTTQSAPPATTTTTTPQATAPQKAQQEGSKLGKLRLGRSRSVSTPVVPAPTQQASDPKAPPPKRRESFNFVPPSLTSDLAYDDHDSSRVDTYFHLNFTGCVTFQQQEGFVQFLVIEIQIPISKPAAAAKEQEDLVSLTKSLPAGVGIPIKRRPLNSKSPSSSSGSPIFKESYHDEHDHHHHHHHFHSSASSSPSEGGGLRFFKRRGSSVVAANTTTPSQRVVLNKNPNREKVSLEDLRDLRLRRVAFAVDRLEHDPQQQIPARRPKRGNVLIPQDINAPVPRLNLGISVETKTDSNRTTKKYTLIEPRSTPKRHINKPRRLPKKSPPSNTIDLVPSRRTNPEKTTRKTPLSISIADAEEGTISLETIYTRCCHLREILPIPATLRQLKNKTAPLEVLKMLNPKPTLIDVLSFSDFIAITPINTVIFDNVTMTTEMLKNFLGSLLYNKQLEKLSLRNVAIDGLGWKYLCKFLAKNKTIKKLDISQQKVKPDTPEIPFLFIQSLILRGGIEELVINGCKLSDEVFEKLITNAVKLSTYRLGIAGANIVANWLTDPNSKCVGVDVAFNDLSQGQLQPFIKAFNKGVSHLIFFSLNSTNLLNVEETTELIKAMVNVKTLRFLDLSSIPEIFPAIITSLIPHLVHASLLGNRSLTNTSAATLYSAVKHSRTLFALDLDYDLISDELSQQYAVENTTDKPEDLMFDGSLLMETAERLLRETDKGGKEDIKMQQIISETIFERTIALEKTFIKPLILYSSSETRALCRLKARRICLNTTNDKSSSNANGTTETNNDPQINLHKNARELITAGPILSPHVNRKGEQNSYFSQRRMTTTSHHTKFVDPPLSSTSVHAKEQEIEEDVPILNTLPSGPELRDAIMAAKGVDNVTELIDRINNNCVKIDGLEVSDTDSIDSNEHPKSVDPVVNEVYDKLLNAAEKVRLNRDIYRIQ